MAITSIPTEKAVPGKTVAAEILVSSVADGKDVFKHQIVVLSREAFAVLRAQGYARLAPENPPEAKENEGKSGKK